MLVAVTLCSYVERAGTGASMIREANSFRIGLADLVFAFELDEVGFAASRIDWAVIGRSAELVVDFLSSLEFGERLVDPALVASVPVDLTYAGFQA